MSHRNEETINPNLAQQQNNAEEEDLYIRGRGYEIYPNVFVEDGTKIYHRDTIRGKMQQLAFDWARVYVNSIDDLEGSIELLKDISYPDSELYFPSQFGFITSREQMIQDVTEFSTIYSAGSVWFPANGW